MFVMKKTILLSLMLFSLLVVLSSCAKVAHSGKLIWHGDPLSNNIFLTFDDGPDPQWTPKALDILKKHNVKATFFLLGERAKRYPEIVKRIHGEGHEIGSHTYSHCDGYNVDKKKILKELKDTDDIIKSITGSSPKYFRPPFGFFNYRYFVVAEELGHKTVLWTFDAGDWGNISAKEMEKKILDKTKGGSIILLHDGGENQEELIKALSNLIDGLRRKGYEFKTLSAIFTQ